MFGTKQKQTKQCLRFVVKRYAVFWPEIKVFEFRLIRVSVCSVSRFVVVDFDHFRYLYTLNNNN